jgi:hypothetical protein
VFNALSKLPQSYLIVICVALPILKERRKGTRETIGEVLFRFSKFAFICVCINAFRLSEEQSRQLSRNTL